MAETSVINKIAIHATEETPRPALPAKGSNMTFSAGWVEMGSLQAGADVDLASDNVSISMDRKLAEIDPTRSLTVEELVLIKNRLANITVTLYDMSEALYAILSDMSVTSNAAQPAAQIAYRTVIVEINGRLIDYFPRCGIFLDSSEAGYGEDGVGTTGIIIIPTATSTYKGGWKREWYQAG